MTLIKEHLPKLEVFSCTTLHFSLYSRFSSTFKVHIISSLTLTSSIMEITKNPSKEAKMKDAIVLYSYPGICHLVAIVELGKLIISRFDGELSVIILLTNGPFDLPATASYTDRVSQTTPGISFHRFPYLQFTPSPALGRMANVTLINLYRYKLGKIIMTGICICISYEK